MSRLTRVRAAVKRGAVLLVAVLPLLSRRLFGPASPSRFARSLRVLCGAAVLALVPAFTVILLFGVVMFAVDPLGLDKWATNPWLPGSSVDPC